MDDLKPKEREMMESRRYDNAYYLNDYGQIVPCEPGNVNKSKLSAQRSRDALAKAVEAIERAYHEDIKRKGKGKKGGGES